MRYAAALSFLGLLSVLVSLVVAMEPDKVQPPKSNSEKPAAGKLDVKDAELREHTTQRAKLHRATPEPHHVLDRTILLCDAPTSSDVKKQKPDNPHENYAVLVYLTENGREMMTSGRGTYPVGTVILKEKMQGKIDPAPGRTIDPRPNARVPPENKLIWDQVLYTGMLKREAGYNPECGDWEFFVVSGDSQKLLARGKIDSCIACHQGYKETDYVTRTYMPAK